MSGLTGALAVGDGDGVFADEGDGVFWDVGDGDIEGVGECVGDRLIEGVGSGVADGEGVAEVSGVGVTTAMAGSVGTGELLFFTLSISQPPRVHISARSCKSIVNRFFIPIRSLLP